METRRPCMVVGYDGSESARAAVEHAVHAAEPDGVVVVVYAFGPPPDWLGTPNYQSVLDDHRGRGQAVLDELEARAAEVFGDVAHELDLLGESPADAILNAAAARDADAVVVGSRGFGFVAGALGSVSHELLHRSDRPVTVIPRGYVEAGREHASMSRSSGTA
jgi:nucleotide-binding universal stress UspA family protein